MDDLKERLRKVEGSVEYGADPGGTVTCWHRNPDGPEAAAYIEALEQHVSALEEALRQCRFELDYCQQQLAAHGQTGHPEDSVSRALRAATAALNREPNP
jgi:hypothetical protein